MSNSVFPRKSYHLSNNLEKYCKAGQATDCNMVHAHCMLANILDYKLALRIYNIYWFSAATIVARTSLNVTPSYLFLGRKLSCCQCMSVQNSVCNSRHYSAHFRALFSRVSLFITRDLII
jgi:hypothetical protein